MTPEQIEIAQAFGRVSFLPGSWDKRLAQTLECHAWMDNARALTEKQEEWMYRLLYKYRRQLPAVYTKYMNHPHCSKKEKKGGHNGNITPGVCEVRQS